MAIRDFFRNQILRVPEKAKKQLEAQGIPFTEAAFLKAVGEGNTTAAMLFLEGGINAGALNDQKETALMLALSGSDTTLATKLVECRCRSERQR